MIYKNYKGIRRIIITILFVITSLVMPNFVNAWEVCFNEYSANDILLSPPPQQIGTESDSIYFYNKALPEWNTDTAYGQLLWKVKGASLSSQDWFTADGQEVTIGGSTASSSDWGNFLIFQSDNAIFNSNFIVQQFYCCAFGSCGYTVHNCYTTSYSGYEDLASNYCFSNFEPTTTPEPEEPEPESNSYILYYGSNPNYTLINTKTNLPVVYNVCDEWEEDSEYTLILEETGTETTPAWENYETELTNCSGSVNFEKNAIDEEELKYVKFSIYKNEEERIAESENFLQVFYQGVLIVNEWINILEENPLYLNRDNISTTSIKYASFLSEEILTEDTEICIINKDKNSSITNCSNQAEEGISYDEIELDLPNFSTTKIITIALVDTSNNQILLESPSLMLIVSSEETIGSIITNQFTGTSTSGFLDLNTHDMACSVESWANDNVFIKIGCSIKKFGLDVLVFPAIVMEKTINSFSILVKNIFPFNIAFSIKTAWDNSEGKNTPADLMWLLPLNENGDITLNLPPNWTKGATTSVVIFGDTIFKNEGTPADKMFKNIRALSTYLLWGGFLWGIYKLAIEFNEDEIKNNKE